jgi:hypothetical protein
LHKKHSGQAYSILLGISGVGGKVTSQDELEKSLKYAMKSKVGLLTLMLLWGLSGCAGTVQSAENRETELRERAMQRWQNLIGGKLDEAYGYLSQGSRDRVPLTSYKGSLRPGMWRDARCRMFLAKRMCARWKWK